MENINSSEVVTHNNIKHFNNEPFSKNQVNIINRNCDLQNGYHDNEVNGNVNLCRIAVNNGLDSKSAKLSNGGEPKYVSIIDVNPSSDFVSVDGGCSGSVFTNGNCDNGFQDLSCKITGNEELVIIPGTKGFPVQDLNHRITENRGFKKSLESVHGFGLKDSEGILDAQQFLSAENGNQVLMNSSQKLGDSEEIPGTHQFLLGENGVNCGQNLQESEDISGSKSILVTESDGFKSILGSKCMIKTESDKNRNCQSDQHKSVHHQELHHSNSGTSDEDNGNHLTMSSKFSNNLNSLESSSGYETDPNVSIVEVNANVDEIMKPALDYYKVCRNRNEAVNREKVINDEGWVLTDDEGEVEESSQEKSLRSDGDVSKTNGSLVGNKKDVPQGSQSYDNDDEDDEEGGSSKDLLMNDDDIDDAIMESDDEDKSASKDCSSRNGVARIDEDMSKSEEGSKDDDEKSRISVGSSRNGDWKSREPSAEKSRGSSQESGKSMDIDVNDESSLNGGIPVNGGKHSNASTSVVKNADVANSATNGASNSDDDKDEDESSQSSAKGTKHSADEANSVRNVASNGVADCAINGARNAGAAISGRNILGHQGNVVDDEDDSCSTSLDGYSSQDEDDVDAKVDQQPQKPQLKRTRSNAGATDYWNEEGEDGCIVEFLDKSTDGAEARLAAKRQARAEAREIRMRELERQQREAEETADKVYDIYSTPDAVQRSSRVAAAIGTPRSAVGVDRLGIVSTNHRSELRETNNSYHSSRRSSEDSLEETSSLRDMRHELKEVEDKFRKAMIANAQLDNEKAAAAYQVELLKDRLEEMDENHSQLNREHRDKCRQFEALKRAAAKLQEDLEWTRVQLEERDRLIEEQGLVIVGGEYSSSGEDDEQNDSSKKQQKMPKRALVSTQVAEVLEKVGSGSLDVRLKKFVEQRNELLDELNRVKLELEEERTRNGANRRLTANGPLTGDGGLTDLDEVQREANKLISDYKFRLQKADQDNSTLQATVARLESQVVRYKTAAEVAEKVEDDLKAERRKLQREYRESQARVEELETAHSHLQKRLDKLKNAKSALLKEL